MSRSEFGTGLVDIWVWLPCGTGLVHVPIKITRGQAAILHIPCSSAAAAEWHPMIDVNRVISVHLIKGHYIKWENLSGYSPPPPANENIFLGDNPTFNAWRDDGYYKNNRDNFPDSPLRLDWFSHVLTEASCKVIILMFRDQDPMEKAQLGQKKRFWTKYHPLLGYFFHRLTDDFAVPVRPLGMYLPTHQVVL